MSTLYEQRVQRLRERVLANQKKQEVIEEVTEEVAEDSGIELDKLSNAELKALLDNKGIEYNSKAVKAELIELIEQAEDIEDEEAE